MARDDVLSPAEAAPVSQAVGRTEQNPHYVLFILYVICLFSYVDRQLIALLAPSIQKELHLKDWQLGFVSGTAFAVLYVVMGIPLSRLADRTNRVRMLGICLAAWSVATAACGGVTSFLQLALARVGVAIGEAGGYPPSISLIGDLYPPQRRATAISIFLSATTAGSLISLTVGGIVSESLGWRWAFFLAAIPAVILVPLLWLTVREPVRGQADAGAMLSAPADERFGGAFRTLLAKPLFVWILAALAVANLETFSLAAWTPTYALRTFGLGPAKVGLGLGLALGVGSGLVMICAGGLADRMTRRWRMSAVYIAILGQIVFVPLLLITMQVHDFTRFCLLYAVTYGCTIALGPMTMAAAQAIVPAPLRGTAAAMLIMTATLAGYGAGPPLIGAISDFFATGSPAERLRLALSLGTVFSAFSALFLARGAWVARERGEAGT
jgi:MFS family permease